MMLTAKTGKKRVPFTVIETFSPCNAYLSYYQGDRYHIIKNICLNSILSFINFDWSTLTNIKSLLDLKVFND